MAGATKIYTIKLDGADQLVKSAADAREALDKLKAQYAALLKQLENQDLTPEALTAIQQSLATTLDSIIALESALDGNEWDNYTAATKTATASNEALNETLDATTAALESQAQAAGDVTVDAATVYEAADAFESLGVNIGLTGETVGELETKLGAMEEELRGVPVNSKRFIELNKQIEGTVKQLETGRKFGEAFALGFKKVGDATNTVEGLKVAITGFEAAYSLATSDVERAELTQAIFQAEEQLVSLQAAAKAGVFPPGSIGRLEAELEGLTAQLRTIPVGTAEFDKVKKRFDQTQRSIELTSLSLEDQRRLYSDLGASATSTLVGVGGLLQTLGADGKEAQEALLRLQQAMALIETIRQVTETAQLARRAAQLAALKAENKELATNTAAITANAGAQGASNAAGAVATKTTKGLVGQVVALGRALLANPVGLIAAAVVALGLAFDALSKKVKPIGDAFNFLRDSFGGITGAFREVAVNGQVLIDFVQELGEALLAYVIGPAKAAAAAVGALFDPEKSASDALISGLRDISKEFEDVADAAGRVGDAFVKGFEDGFARARRLREIEGAQQLLEAKKQAKALSDAALGNERATVAARRATNVALLQEQRALASERLKLEERLTDEEIRLVQSGNVEKLKQIQKFVNARGDVDADLIARVQEITDLDAQVLQEAEAARLDAIAARTQAVADNLELTRQALNEASTFANRYRTVEAERLAELQRLQLSFQKGDFASREEYNRQVLIAQGRFNEQRRALALEEAEFIRQVEATRRNEQIETLAFEREQLERRGTLTVEREISIVEETSKLRKATVQDEITALDALDAQRLTKLRAAQVELTAAQRAGDAKRIALAQTTVAALGAQDEKQVARRRELANELTVIEREAAAERFDAAEKAIERENEARLRAIELAKQQLAIARTRQDTRDTGAQAALQAATVELERQKVLATTITGQSRALRAEAELLTEQYELQRKALEQAAARRREDLALEVQAVQAELARLQERQGLGIVTPAELDRVEELKLKLQELDAQDVQVEAKLAIDTSALDTEQLNKQAQLAGQSVRAAFEATGRGLGDSLRKGVADVISAGLFEKFIKDNPDATSEELAAARARGEEVGKAYAEGITATAAELGGQLLQLQEVLANAAIERYERDAEFFQEQADAAQERIDELTTAAEDSAATILDLEQQVAIARGANSEALQTQLNAEAERRAALQQQIRREENERARFEKQSQDAARKADEARKRQAAIGKAIAITQAIINTAQAVTAALNIQPVVPLGVAAAALAGALGAAQVATIVAQPTPAADGGLLTPGGELMQDGGIIKGPSHAAGGVRGKGSFAGIEAEGGEAIIPRNAVAINRPVIDALLNEGRHRPLRVMADGGILGAVTERIRALDTAPLSVRPEVVETAGAGGMAELAQAMQAVAARPVYAAITDINDGIQRMQIVNTNAGF